MCPRADHSTRAGGRERIAGRSLRNETTLQLLNRKPLLRECPTSPPAKGAEYRRHPGARLALQSNNLRYWRVANTALPIMGADGSDKGAGILLLGRRDDLEVLIFARHRRARLVDVPLVL